MKLLTAFKNILFTDVSVSTLNLISFLIGILAKASFRSAGAYASVTGWLFRGFWLVITTVLEERFDRAKFGFLQMLHASLSKKICSPFGAQSRIRSSTVDTTK